MSDPLEFQSVRMALPGGEVSEAVSFSVATGRIAVLADATGGLAEPVADLASGLTDPVSGAVRLDGQDWRDMAPAREAHHRGRIGRVFRARPWIANLDMDENIVLAGVHHGRASRPELLRRAGELARELGLADGIPAKRPAWITPVESALCQWTRALLGDKVLLLLEDPFQHLPAAAMQTCLAALRRRAGTGAAALLIVPESHLPALNSLPDSITLPPMRASGAHREQTL